MLATPDALLFMQLRHIVLWSSRKRGKINLESYRDNISLFMSGRLIAGDSDGSDQYIGIREDMSKISASAIFHIYNIANEHLTSLSSISEHSIPFTPSY